MITFVISIITLLSGFAFYSRYIESVMKDDLVRPTPATTLNDGENPSCQSPLGSFWAWPYWLTVLGGMPKERLGDALHLALASYHKCDFLLTWNCRHIANANKFAHIRTINSRLGLFVPTLVTPMGLFEEDTP